VLLEQCVGDSDIDRFGPQTNDPPSYGCLATYVGEAGPVDKEVAQGRGEGGIVDVHLVLAPADTI
jgi:hypothetical protein